MKKVFFLFLACFLVPSLACPWPATVQRVLDGDTVAVCPLGDTSTALHIRLYGIDTPESSQSHGGEATAYLQGLLPTGKQVEVIPMGVDNYGRSIALLYADRVNVNAEQIKAGNAWLYAKYCKASFCKQWQALQRDAAQSRRGLWREPTPQAPWQYRKARKGQGGADMGQ